jgi:tripartite-type tricarboxylate transporter receptor subunit TctC
MPHLLSRLAGAKFKLISGYRSANEALLAMDRGEIDMVGAFGISTLAMQFGPRLKDGSIRPVYLSALSRHPDFPALPTIGELGHDDEGKQILDLFASSSAVGRTLAAPPGLPQDRIAVLRKAMAAALSDPELLAFSAERNMALEPTSGEEIEGIVRKILATSPLIARKAAAVLQSLSR